MRTLLITLLALLGLSASANSLQDSTLRLDYILGKMPGQQPVILLDHARITPGWHGRKHHLQEMPVPGNGQLLMTDRATGDTLYVYTFNTLFQEWEVSPEADSTSRSFQHTVLAPLPSAPANVILTLTDARGQVVSTCREVYDPTDVLVQRPTKINVPAHRYLHGSPDGPATINVAIVGEGYTQAEMPKFYEQAQTAVNSILSYEPFSSRQDAFNFIAVEAPSAESGVSVPKRGEWKDTPFGSHFSTFYADRYLTTSHVWAVHDALEGVPYEHIIILANTDEYGGGGIYNAQTLTAAGNEWFEPVVAHEFGHSFGGLADEYFYDHPDIATNSYPTDVEPWEPNITTLVDFQSKWADMLPAGTHIPTQAREGSTAEDNDPALGVYEGGGYVAHGVYRPVDYCRMRATKSAQVFCPVCQRALARMIDFYAQ